MSDLIASRSGGGQRSATIAFLITPSPLPPGSFYLLLPRREAEASAERENTRAPFTVGARGACERGALLPRCRLRKYSRSFCALRASMAGDPRRMNTRICIYLTMREEQRATPEIKISYSRLAFFARSKRSVSRALKTEPKSRDP